MLTFDKSSGDKSSGDKPSVDILAPAYLTALLLFLIALLFSVIAVDFTIGSVPVRALFVVASLFAIAWGSPSSMLDSIDQYHRLIVIIGLMAGLGAVVSLINGSGPVLVLRQLVEIHLQAAIGFILATSLTRIFGIRIIVFAFILVWDLSALFALLQILDVGFAWDVRASLGDLMNDPAITRRFYDDKERALGLSFTPVHLATQTCLAFAGFCAYRHHVTNGGAFRRWDWQLACAAMAAILVCIVSGNRSPIVGIIIFGSIYAIVVSPRLVAVASPLLFLILLSAPWALEVLSQSGFRFAQTSDGSALGRSTLAYYGWQLFLDRPFGYGLLFDSMGHAGSYAHHVIHMDNSKIIEVFSLHNFYLLALNKYGIFILCIIPWIWPRTRTARLGWLSYVPYLVHIGFHNEGPLSSDFLIWFLIPASLFAFGSSPKLAQSTRQPFAGQAT